MADIQLSGRVGPAYGTDSTAQPLRQGATAELMVSQLQPRYYENVYRGNTFIAHNVSAQAVSAALATTYTGLVLVNPANSGKNLVLQAAGFALSVAPAGIASLHLIGTSSATAVTLTTPLAAPGIQNCLIGSGQATVAKVCSAATIPTPGYIMALNSGFTAAALPSSPQTLVPIDGMIVLAPGSFAGIGALTAVTGFGCLVWTEIPV